MSISAPPRPRQPRADDAEALIREARLRQQRRRRRIFLLLLSITALVAVSGTYVVSDHTGWNSRAPGLSIAGAIAAPSPGLVYGTAAGYTASIWHARIDGGEPRRIAQGSSPTLSPDGRWVAFVRTSQNPSRSELLLISSTGGSTGVLQRVEGEFLDTPVWAPDSRHLVSVNDGGPNENGGLELIDIASGTPKLFAAGKPGSGVGSPSFSPDGRKIVYSRFYQTGADLEVYDSTNGETRQITHDHDAFEPSWGPNWIAYFRGGSSHAGDVWLIREDGRGAYRLTHTSAGIFPVAWSQDGKRLLAANPAIHNGRLWAVDVASGRARDLTGWVGDLFPQGLSRDGTTILVAIGCGGMASPNGKVETLPFAGGEPKLIATGPCRASWNS